MPTGAWILPDERPLPAELVAFLDAGTPPVYGGFGSMHMRASKDVAGVAIEAIRAQGRRALVSRGWANLALIDDRDDFFVVVEVNQQALFDRVADLGIGTAHDGPTPATESLSAALRTTLTPETRARATAMTARSAPTGRRWPRSCCSTRSAEKSRQYPREPHGIVEPGKVPGAGLHRQLGMLEETGILGGVPRRQPDVVLTGEQQHRLPRSFC